MVDAKTQLMRVLSIALGILFFINIGIEPIAQLLDIENANVTLLDGSQVLFGSVASTAVLSMLGIVALIIVIVFLMGYVNMIKGKG